MATERIAVQFTVHRTVTETIELEGGQTAEITRVIEEIVTRWIDVEVSEDLGPAQEEVLRQLVTEHVDIDDAGDVAFDRDGFETAVEEAFADAEVTITSEEIDALETALEGVDEQIDAAIDDADSFVIVGPRSTIDTARLVSSDDFGILTVPPGDAARADLERLLGSGVYLTTGVPNPNVAPNVIDGLVRAMNDGRINPELVMSLAQSANADDPLAAAALFAMAFDDLDAPLGDSTGDAWTAATGCGWMGGQGGNCATFVSCAYLYSGLEHPPGFGWDPGDASLPNGDARGASELAYLFLTNWGSNRGERVEVSDFSTLRPGDFVYQGSELQDLPPDDQFDHVSMVVGFGPADGGPGAPVFATYAEAATFYAELGVEITPYVVDHNPDNFSATPRPWTEANPFAAEDRFGVRINARASW